MKAVRLLAALLAALVLAGCGRFGAHGAVGQQASEASTRPSLAVSAPPICNGGDASPSPAAVGALGPAARETRFRLSEPITEFRMRLLNRFKLPRDASAVIVERTWAKGECRLTIWSTPTREGKHPVQLIRWRVGDAF